MIILALLALALSAFAVVGPAPRAHASSRSASYWALKWAESKAGCWYSWGGTSCAQGFDCSGLVMEAFAHEGFALPRTVYEMVYSGRIYPVAASQRRQGDLAIWGTSHVELVTQHGTFGAQQSGTRVGWHRLWGSPVFYRIR